MDTFGLPNLDMIQHPGGRMRIQDLNRFRYLNIAVKATQSAATVALPASSATDWAFDNNQFISEPSLHSTTVNNTRFYPPINGYYLCGCEISDGGTANFFVDLGINGVVQDRLGSQSNVVDSTGGMTIRKLTVGDYIHFRVNNGGIASTIYGDATQNSLTWAFMAYLGEGP